MNGAANDMDVALAPNEVCGGDATETDQAARATLAECQVMARALASSQHPEHRTGLAHAFTAAVVSAYWDASQIVQGQSWSVPKLHRSFKLMSISDSTRALAATTGAAAAELSVDEASYLIGGLYTAMLPEKIRSSFGAYYTPPALCERLLDVATDSGVDWKTARVLDPACGGGAFLAPVARRMADELKECSAKIAIKNISNRLHGFEIDPFAAWMSRVFLEIVLMPLCLKANVRLPNVITVCNSLEREPDKKGFDLVIGNPPYGRVKLSTEMRDQYKRSLFGHANLYGLFTDLALRHTRPGGLIAYVTPTSFLAGEYFKALRGLLGKEAAPVAVDFVSDRKGVFEDVLQETLLAVYRRGGEPGLGKVHFLTGDKNGTIKVSRAGSFQLPLAPDTPWLIPRGKDDCELIRTAQKKKWRLADYSYKVSTGPLVWNRHKSSLRDRAAKGRYPLIWAEAVRGDGTFEFRAQKKNHKPYFEPAEDEAWVVTSSPCVLLQRTTAKEQLRRLIAAELPAAFLEQNGSVVIENHLNMIRPKGGQKGDISTAALAAFLNTKVVDQLFRCINGSVAVSAYELEALPLPAPRSMKRFEKLVAEGASKEELEEVAAKLYRG